MKFRNYCAIIMGKFDKDMIIEELKKISESPTNSIDTGGIMVATFTSVLEPSELGELFKGFGVNHMVFDLDTKSSAVHMNNPVLQDGLFGLINNLNSDELDGMTSRLLRDISMSSTTKEQNPQPRTQRVKKAKKEDEMTEEDVDKMSPKEKQRKLDEYIDFGNRNGFEKLTEHDRKIMELLAK